MQAATRRTIPVCALLLAGACSDSIPKPAEPRAALVNQHVDARARSPKVIPGEWVIELQPSMADRVGAMRGILKNENGRLKSDHLAIANGFVAYLSDAQAQRIAKLPFVKSVQPNMAAVLHATQTPTKWGLDRIDQRDRPADGRYFYGMNGSGVHIYIIDTGIRPNHDDFGGRASADVATAGDNQGPEDLDGHGTGVASIAGGSTFGVAKGARLHGVRVFDRFGFADISSIVHGIDWVRTNRTLPAVANLSLGFNGVVPVVDNALRSLIASGVTVTVADGNLGNSCSQTPSSVQEAIVVASVDSFDIRTAWSSDGSCVDLYAPGVDIPAAYYWGNPAVTNDSAWFTGTSASAPLAAGVAAILLQKSPSLTPASVQSTILNESTPNVVQYPGLGTPNRLLFATPRASLTVGISGLPTIKRAGYYTWSASASGGSGPYSYTWERSDDGGPYYTVNYGPSYTSYVDRSNMTIDLRVTVTAGPDFGIADKHVAVIIP